MSKTNNYLFTGLHIVAWIIFVGLCIEAGGILVNFIISLFKPEIIKNLYQKLDLMEVYRTSKFAYFMIYGLIVVLAILKACLFYFVIHLMQKMYLLKPFSQFVSKQILWISYITLAIGFISFFGAVFDKELRLDGVVMAHSLSQFWGDSEAFILMGAVIYIIAIIFQKGVTIQEELDLTV
jgi:hypothetical protein